MGEHLASPLNTLNHFHSMTDTVTESLTADTLADWTVAVKFVVAVILWATGNSVDFQEIWR